ncbi:response regulator [Nitrosophilus alvini]|uniref:response regulator n=1 Tax=Nitrosophilus alvini TaxID=2714855 RepID=UPI00190C775E|nr:response regulator [Nitrosophilus alvini]
MRILIVENEIYLAQSIASKLTELGHTCETAAGIVDAIKNEQFDAVLLSTNINGQDFYPVIEHYNNSIIILLVSYISNDTVSNPLKAGANDYILKPFMMEELIRKIEHFRDYEALKKQNETYRAYIEYTLKGISIENISTKEKLPLFIKTDYQKNADLYAFRYAEKTNTPFVFISLNDSNAFSRIKKISDSLMYITDFQTLKKSEKKLFLELIEDKNAIVSTTDSSEELPFNSIEIKSDNKIFDRNDILPIDDYVKYIIMNYQSKFPDTTLAKKLGISRKSLWEKRKKYEIFKKK